MKKNFKLIVTLVLLIGLVFFCLNQLSTSITTNSTTKDEKYTPAKRKEYKKNTESFILTPANEIEAIIANNESIYLYFGRGSCPSCRAFVPDLNKYSTLHKQTIYYVDTEDRENQEIKAARDLFEVKAVPTLLKVSKDGKYERFNSNAQELSEFLNPAAE